MPIMYLHQNFIPSLKTVNTCRSVGFLISQLIRIHSVFHTHAESIDPDKENFERKIVIIFLPINLNMCFGCSKEPSH